MENKIEPLIEPEEPSEEPTKVKSNIIELNIGGTRYTTTKETLTSNSGYFSAMLKNFREGEERKEIFIDRDGELFRHVLYFLRTKELLSIIDERTEEVLREADFFNIPEMSEKIKSDKIRWFYRTVYSLDSWEWSKFLAEPKRGLEVIDIEINNTGSIKLKYKYTNSNCFPYYKIDSDYSPSYQNKDISKEDDMEEYTEQKLVSADGSRIVILYRWKAREKDLCRSGVYSNIKIGP